LALHFGTSVQAVRNPIKPCSDRILGISGRPSGDPIASLKREYMVVSDPAAGHAFVCWV